MSSMKLPDGRVVKSADLIYPGSHFTWGEATKNCTRVPATVAIAQTIERTAREMDKIRAFLGSRPITITSWYRPPAVNKAVGGATQSRHLLGDGVDFVVTGLTPAQVQKLLDPTHSGGLGYGKTFTHVDFRGFRARFNYG